MMAFFIGYIPTDAVADLPEPDWYDQNDFYDTSDAEANFEARIDNEPV